MQDLTKREYIEIAIVIIAVFIAIPIAFLSLPKKGDIVRIDCTWSEISPDFSNEMREACRQARLANKSSK